MKNLIKISLRIKMSFTSSELIVDTAETNPEKKE